MTDAPQTRRIALRVNGTRHEAEAEVRTTLADFLRHGLGLTGTHLGCEHGVCGACTILFDGRSARSCLMLAVQADGHEVTTIEGIAGEAGEPHPLQAAFRDNHGLQCGFCTPGILTTLVEFLGGNPDPTAQEVRIALSGNLCRCTGYAGIVAAALDAAKRLRDGGTAAADEAHIPAAHVPAALGDRLPRREDEALLQGRGRFIDDIDLPGMVHAAFVRSPHAHAAITGIGKRAALAVTGVHAVLTLADLRPHLKMERLVVGLPSASYKQDLNRPVLADAEVVHVGEAVAIVVADSRAVAEDAAALVDVDYDIRPAAADCSKALAAGAPTVHDASPDNLLAEFDMAYGDCDAAFAGAAHVFAENIWQHRGTGLPIECRGAVATFDPLEDRLTLWSGTQMPHAAKRLLANILGFEENRLRVVAPDIGGGFGPKLVFYPEDAATALAALIVGRPVKWIEDRREHFTATTQERDQYWEAEIAVDDDGRILGIRGSIIHDHGAYTARGVNTAYNTPPKRCPCPTRCPPTR